MADVSTKLCSGHLLGSHSTGSESLQPSQPNTPGPSAWHEESPDAYSVLWEISHVSPKHCENFCKKSTELRSDFCLSPSMHTCD